jgi:hypothetical protein
MSYCNPGEKATVNYTSNSGVQSKFTTKNTPIDIECNENKRTGRLIFTLRDFGYIGNCQSSGQQFVDTIIADSYTVSPIIVGGQFANCPWFRLVFFVGQAQVFSAEKTFRYSVSQVANPNYNPGFKTLIIKDSRGNKLFETEVKDCNYTSNCGDECPPNHIKCECSGYPGYCCIPCSEIRNGIAAATAAVRSKNHG